MRVRNEIKAKKRRIRWKLLTARTEWSIIWQKKAVISC